MCSAPFNRFPCKRHLCSPRLSQILPPRVPRLNERNLLRPCPAFQLFLATDRFMNVVKALVIDKSIAVIFTGESRYFAVLVFKSPALDAVRHPDVQRSRSTAYDVHEVFVVFHYSTQFLSSRAKLPSAKRAATQSKDPVTLNLAGMCQGVSTTHLTSS